MPSSSLQLPSVESLADSLIPPGQLPTYLADVFGELYAEDGLLVLGEGLGLLSLMASFVRFYGDVKEGHVAITSEETKEGLGSGDSGYGNDIKPPLVFVLGLRENERNALVAMLEMWGTPPELLPTMITNESGQGKDRALIYNRGGVFIITSRILIVDLLTNIAHPKDIEGILVAHAENVTEQSTEAFILRIFRTQKQLAAQHNESMGFVKAFSGAPGAIMSGFAKVDKILKALHVRRLYLYPRFHESIAVELERTPPHVDELHQELSPGMKEIQGAIAAAVQTCMRELKNSTTLLEWTDPDLSIENCVTSNFDKAISRQLENDWHRLRPQTKQLVQDLRTLRTLFQSLIQYDCVGFWKLINSIKTMSAAFRYPSMWLLTPAADLLFRKSKERIYTISTQKPTAQNSNPIARLTPVLEENPKWRLLRRVLSEIQEEYEQMKQKSNHRAASILMMVKDERTLDTIRSYLVDGKERTMTLRWLRFLESYNDRSRSVTRNSGGTSAISEESRLLLEDESRARLLLFGRNSNAHKKTRHNDTTFPPEKGKRLNNVPDYTRKRRRIATERGRGEQTLQTDDLARRAVLDEAVEEAERELNSNEMYESTAMKIDTVRDESSSDDEEERRFKVSALEELNVVLRSYSNVEGDQGTLLLQDINPSYIVLYDADVSFIRAIEIHSSNYHGKEEEERLRVFFMLFEASAEEKNFMKTLEREQNAFERLIQHKKTMPMPMYTLGAGSTQEMQQALMSGSGPGGTYAKGKLPLSMDIRTGRGKTKAGNERRDIAVDVREFRSALPSILHQGGMRLAPVTLTVGDFVLSNVHCVERKSISDLFGSFASGRLFTQAESMSKHYKCPCLLVEFDPAKSFSLQNQNELGVEIRADAVCSKMALLTMHFPKLRILWSRAPHETLRVFQALKINHEEVNVDRAVEIGSNESIDAVLQEGVDDDVEDEVNEAGRDMLLRLPGVNLHSARKIMSECDSIAELSQMSREKLRKIAGPLTGQKMFTFFRQSVAEI